MTTTTITAELLDALLSTDTQRRREAVEYFQALPVNERVAGLLPHVVVQQTLLPQQQQQQRHSHLAGVLLRRDILRLTDPQAVESLVDPLLGSFLVANNTDGRGQARVAIGHCLAEICGTIALLSPSLKDKEQVMTRILNAISDAVAQGDVPSLRLLAAMAERAPAAFATSAASSLENLTKQIATAAASLSSPSKDTILEALMQVLVQGAIATQHPSQDSPILPFSNLQAVDKVDPTSSAAVLGRTCLPSLTAHAMTLAGPSTLNILQEWNQAATQCPSFLAGDKSVLGMILQTCLSLAYTHHQSDSTIALAALEVMSSICAVGDVKRKILAQDPVLCQTILQGQQQQQQQQQQQGVIALAIYFMTTGMDDDVEGWAQEPASLLEEDPWDDDDIAHHGESLLQSFLHSFGSFALGVALPLIETLLQSTADWKRPCSGLAAMVACLAFVPVSFAPHLATATQAALNMATPAQPIRVQWQALRLLGVLCESDVRLEQSHSVQILQTLAQAVQSSCTKVSALACMAIVSFCRGGEGMKSEGDGPHPVVPYLSDLLQALTTGPLSLQVVDCGTAVVTNRAIGAVACLAQTSGEAFVPFYAAVMPGLLACSQMHMQTQQQQQHKNHGGGYEINQLVGAAIEAATIVGQAIESEEASRSQYVKDAEQIMHYILPILQQHEHGTSEMPLDPLLSACARIATVMGADYVPFVPMVLPHLLKRATAPPDLSVTEGDEAGLDATKRHELEIDEDMGTESITVATPGKGIQKFTVNTSQMQEKSQAARAVYEHAAALGADFSPFVDQCMNAFVPLVEFKFSPDVRSTSAQAVASIFEAACQAADESAIEAKKLQHFFPVLTKLLTQQIHVESPAEMEAFYALADALSEVFYSVYQRKDSYGRLVAASVSLAEATVNVEMIMNAISTCLRRRSAIYSVLSGQDGSLTREDEKEECHAQLKAEERLLTPLVDSVGYTIKFFKESFIPVFETSVAPVLGPSLTNGDIRARLCAVCLYDDCVEHCCGSEATAKHAEKLVYGILLGIDANCNGGDRDLLSASIYGVSQICRYAPNSVLDPHLETIFHYLLVVVKSTTKEETDNPMVYENAVSALASLVLIGASPFASSGFVKPEDVLTLFVDNLPLREDPDEAKICHAGFCDLVEKGSINLETEAKKVLQVVGEILCFVSEGEDLASQDTCSRLAGILVQMQQQLSPDRINAAFEGISLEAQNGINLAMQG